ncbi:NAD(P)H-flavin reductase [Thermanaeromonas toyohensis ToBE]|uniref:NAD(P)H-flavin reductase n=1 Tax=Thermanaeromonas toyohensis ToBE TaxID=698762 RepID=A0A1W1VZU5_9FIRM|nr:FAD/NAD(P)-binding protein [Thermanaeromonas toyohensis]SMB98875.1 NAD(P)H-flavin reductase [Thermanaeromonas toyohensis ToBE]
MFNPFKPERAVIKEIIRETHDTTTYTFSFIDEEVRRDFRFRPGQFNMLTIFGIGEAPISISSSPVQTETFQHTIRHVGNVTNALARMKPGDVVGIRGPYGTGWPLDVLPIKNLLIVAGGIGLAPLRPVIREVVHRRKEFGQVEILYGARTPADLLYTPEYQLWRQSDIILRLTVDMVPPGTEWKDEVGVVTKLFDKMSSRPEETTVFTCGPEIMMAFVVKGLLARGFRPEQIYVSLERRMNCGVKKCGKCQIGPKFVCRDGPVFAYAELLSLPEEVLGGAAR